MPIFGHTVFGHNSANWAEFFMGVQETDINRLLMRNLSYDAYFSFFYFWATFGGKTGVITTCTLYGLGPPNLTKELAHWVVGWTFWANYYFEIMFTKFSGVNPHLKSRMYEEICIRGK